MEYRKNHMKRNVVRSRPNKVKQCLQNVALKETATVTSYETARSKPTDKCTNKTNKKTNIWEGVKVKETYDELLDLRNTVIKGSSNDSEKKCNSSKPSSDAEQTFLDKVCEFPNMHYKIMTLCSVKNSSKFTEQFNTKTNIISERIVNKQLELQATEKSQLKTKQLCKVPPKLGEKIVIQKIIQKENELQCKNLAKKTPKLVKSKSEMNISKEKSKSISDSKSEYNSNKDTSKPQTPQLQLSSKPEITDSISKASDCYEIAKSRFQRSIIAGMNKASIRKTEPTSKKGSIENSSLELKKSNASRGQIRETRTKSLERCRPRFLLSTKPKTRYAVSHSSVQVNMEKSTGCINTQTENMIQLRNMEVQTKKKNITNEKKMQTRLCKTDTVETDPIIIENPAKYTSTTCDFYHSEQPTQMYEYLTTSDLVCLDWVNRHLFGVSVNPHNIIVDDKIKEVSEVASKSTFLSEMECLALPR